MPVRVTIAAERDAFTWPGRTLVQGGAGLRYLLRRSGS